MAEGDVVQFGEELARFDAGPESVSDYQAALDAYESARRLVDKLRTDAVHEIVELLIEGRYALACARARSTGAPRPERRTPCFFNPQHGPSSTDVVWTPASGPTRRVPACAQDAARVQAGEDPPVRYGEVQLPEWDGVTPNEPYRLGFFAGVARAQINAVMGELKGEGRGQWGNDFGGRRKRKRLPYD